MGQDGGSQMHKTLWKLFLLGILPASAWHSGLADKFPEFVMPLTVIWAGILWPRIEPDDPSREHT